MVLTETSSYMSFLSVIYSVLVNYREVSSENLRGWGNLHTCLDELCRNSRRVFLTFSPANKIGSSREMPVSSQWSSYISPRVMYEQSVWNNRSVGLQEMAAGRWNERLRFRVSFFRCNTLYHRVRDTIATEPGKRNQPIECPENLHNFILAATLTMTGNLNHERGLRVVITMKSESLPTSPVRATELKL